MHATCSGERPLVSWLSLDAECSSNKRATASKPRAAAACSTEPSSVEVEALGDASRSSSANTSRALLLSTAATRARSISRDLECDDCGCPTPSDGVADELIWEGSQQTSAGQAIKQPSNQARKQA